MKMNRLNRRGLTLIEVVVAMLLLGTLLVSLLVVFSRHAVQIDKSLERLHVIQKAESQLAEWHLQFGFAPANEEGEWTIDGKTYRWRTEPIEQMIDQQMMLGKISFEVFETRSKIPILSIQLVVPSWQSL
ncbi:MAG: prepilin-type N-terminal cleavage/methylation domain-containing protein [Planctomycetaceae bacterium]|jgi:type II secretion system protein I|nr:prepilin-type N-terminal cleavage/methylation domain-containing protein [Planctomycetaceae bacterium]